MKELLVCEANANTPYVTKRIICIPNPKNLMMAVSTLKDLEYLNPNNSLWVEVDNIIVSSYDIDKIESLKDKPEEQFNFVSKVLKTITQRMYCVRDDKH